jgi:hypothetical protein
MSVPQLAAIAALSLAGFIYSQQPAREAARGVQQTCQEKYCPPTYMIHVDRPVNTLMRDDRAPSGGTLDQKLAAAYALSKDTYFTEAHSHPGVRLVAHAVS